MSAKDESSAPRKWELEIAERRRQEDEEAAKLMINTRRFFLAVGDPYAVWFQYFQSAVDLEVASRDSLRMARRVPGVWSDLMSRIKSQVPRADRQEVPEELLEQMRERAVRAAAEVDLGFPRLHAHTLMGLWGALSTFVEDAAVAAIMENPHLLDSEALRFHAKKMDLHPNRPQASDAYLLLLRKASRRNRSQKAASHEDPEHADPFEATLSLVGLAGVVPDAVGRDLALARAVRNLWAHRGGVVGGSLSTLTRRWQPGERAYIDPGLANRMQQAMFVYAQVVLARWCDEFGVPRVILEAPLYPQWEDELPPEPVKMGAGGIVLAGPGMPSDPWPTAEPDEDTSSG